MRGSKVSLFFIQLMYLEVKCWCCNKHSSFLKDLDYLNDVRPRQRLECFIYYCKSLWHQQFVTELHMTSAPPYLTVFVFISFSCGNNIFFTVLSEKVDFLGFLGSQILLRAWCCCFIVTIQYVKYICLLFLFAETRVLWL